MLAILLAAAAICTDTQGIPPTVKTEASAEILYSSYPVAAKAKGATGFATVSCQIDVNGQAGPCTIVDESPPALGFGDAAVNVVHQMTFVPSSRCGVPQAELITTKINFAFLPSANYQAVSDEARSLAKILVETIGIPEGSRMAITDDWANVMVQGGQYTESQHQIAVDIANELYTKESTHLIEYMIKNYSLLDIETLKAAVKFSTTSQGQQILREEMYESISISRGLYGASINQALKVEFCKRSQACQRAPTP